MMATAIMLLNSSHKGDNQVPSLRRDWVRFTSDAKHSESVKVVDWEAVRLAQSNLTASTPARFWG